MEKIKKLFYTKLFKVPEDTDISDVQAQLLSDLHTLTSKNKMVVAKAEAAIPIVVVTLFWLGVGAVSPWFIKGPNRRLIQVLFCTVKL